MPLPSFIVHQLGRPTGVLGSVFLWLLDRVNRDMQSAALNAMSLRTDDRVLEIGFGSGDLLDRILSNTQAGKINGLEISDLAVRKAKKRFSSAIRSGRLSLIHHTGPNMGFADRAFTVVCGVNVVYFWKDTAATLSEIKRVLAPEGRLVLCYNATGPNGIEVMPSQIEALMKGVGFGAIETTPFHSTHNGNCYWTRGFGP